MDGGDTEPLVSDTNDPYPDSPPGYTEVDESQPSASPSASPIATTTNSSAGSGSYVNDELPPPYSPHVITTHVTCKVCCNPISLQSRQNLHVVKCSICNEATPIKNAPPGKKYVRCPCNCLLICGIEAVRIACPRVNCRRIVRVQQPITAVSVNSTIPTVRVKCVHCTNIFMFQRVDMHSKLARCNHCGRVSFVGRDLKKRKLLIFGLIGALFLLSGTVVTVVTMSMTPMTGIYFVWIGAFLAGLLNLIRAAYWASVKVSYPIQ